MVKGNVVAMLIGSTTDFAPLRNVSVYQQDKTSNGTTTDAKGDFKLEVPKGKNIVFSYTGMAPQVFTVATGNDVLTVTLTPGSTTLPEVEITGTRAPASISPAWAIIPGAVLIFCLIKILKK
jgi:hypothetical protein